MLIQAPRIAGKSPMLRRCGPLSFRPLLIPPFYSYSPVPMSEMWKNKDCRPCKLLMACSAGILVGVAIMVVPLSFFVEQTKSEACQGGLRVEERCRNVTDHLRGQLSAAWQAVREDQATCNSTVENLNATLTKMKTQMQKQQEQMQDLKNEIMDLKQRLQESQEGERQLRNELNAIRQMGPKNSAQSLAISIGLAPAVLLLLSLSALWPRGRSLC